MRRKVPRLLGLLTRSVLALFFLVAAAAGQTPSLLPGQTHQIGELLHHGQQLEQERRWGDALTHYEEAVRQFPENGRLQQRFEYARVHYDVGRRYEDRSYCGLIARLTLEGAVKAYDDVLLKIQSHYVESPDWRELVNRGTNSFEVALTNPAFLRWHGPTLTEDAVGRFRNELRQTLGSRGIESRSDAREAVAYTAALADSRLGISPSATAMEYTCGAANSLDVYSAYLSPIQLNDIYSQIEGNFVGLGVELRADNGALLIVRVISGSPAKAAGIRAEDRITSVDGRSTQGLSTDQAANMLQGEAGSVVDLVVATPGADPRRVRVQRQRVEVPSVDHVGILDNCPGVGYLKLTCFQKTTCRDLDAALWNLHRAGMRSLIVDLRGNPGGLLVTAVEVVDKFVNQGVIVSTRGRSLQEDFTYSAHEAGTWGVPLVVIIDQDSASAAEIFAGAIRDHRRGTIIGKRSYGKGSVQGIFPLGSTNAGIRLTTSRFYSPGGHPYSRVGVQPDLVVQVHQTARPIDGSAPLPQSSVEDPMLAAARNVAQELLAQR